jgi:hypothetical protein
VSPLISALAVINQILAAGIAITAFSLLLYALTFNLRERVARTFAALLASVTWVYFFDTLVSTFNQPDQVGLWLRMQWVGIVFVPSAYLHFSDALLRSTGERDSPRRRLAVRLAYLASAIFLLAAVFSDILIKEAVIEPRSGAAHLRPGPLFAGFLAFFLFNLAWAAWSFVRAYRRCQTSTARRRMIYLLLSASAPWLGTFPFLLIGGQASAWHPLLFWVFVLATNVVVTGLLVVMAYTVAYFGVMQPDRVVKARLFQWLLRGPVVASTVLAVYVVVTRLGPRLALYDTRLVPFLLVGTLIMLQFFITLVRLPVERALFYGAEISEIRRLQVLEERLLTTGDLRQFFESVLVSICNVLRIPAAFLVAFDRSGKVEYQVGVGPGGPFDELADLPQLDALRPARVPESPEPRAGVPAGDVFEWGEYWIVPLRHQDTNEVLGLLGLQHRADQAGLSAAEAAAIEGLVARAVAALGDRRLQQAVFQALDRALPEIDAVQRLRAAGSYPGAPAPTSGVAESPDLIPMLKDALTHYWGGPKLTQSPLLGLQAVDWTIREQGGSASSALRTVLRQAIERLKPEGQRRFTGDWILYNILELKFLQGRRVRDVAMRLAVSEADLYRKQRLALEEVAAAIRAMEAEASAKMRQAEARPPGGNGAARNGQAKEASPLEESRGA